LYSKEFVIKEESSEACAVGPIQTKISFEKQFQSNSKAGNNLVES
jgi:hypothetical protein